MLTAIYNNYYWEEWELAKQQLKFFEDKLKLLEKEIDTTPNKSIRKRRLELNIYCIKYTYNL
jgi:hypothetical protein